MPKIQVGGNFTRGIRELKEWMTDRNDIVTEALQNFSSLLFSTLRKEYVTTEANAGLRYVMKEDIAELIAADWLALKDIEVKPSSKYPDYVKIVAIDPDAIAKALKTKAHGNASLLKDAENVCAIMTSANKRELLFSPVNVDKRHGVEIAVFLFKESKACSDFHYSTGMNTELFSMLSCAMNLLENDKNITPQERKKIQLIRKSERLGTVFTEFGLRSVMGRLYKEIDRLESLKDIEALLFQDAEKSLLKDEVMLCFSNFETLLESLGYQKDNGVNLITRIIRHGRASTEMPAFTDELYQKGELLHKQLSDMIYLRHFEQDALSITNDSLERLEKEELKSHETPVTKALVSALVLERAENILQRKYQDPVEKIREDMRESLRQEFEFREAELESKRGKELIESTGYLRSHVEKAATRMDIIKAIAQGLPKTASQQCIGAAPGATNASSPMGNSAARS